MAKRKMTLEEKLEEAIVKDAPYEVPKNWVWIRYKYIIREAKLGLVRGCKQQSIDKKYMYLKMNNITRSGKLDLNNVINIDASEYEVDSFSLQEGDFLFNTRNSRELVGKNTVVNRYFKEPILYNNNIMRVRFNSLANSKVISYYFNSPQGEFKLDEIKRVTTNVAAIYSKDLNSISIPLPPLQEQQRIVARIESLFEKLDNAKELIEEARDDFEKRKSAILEKAFRGELTLSDNRQYSSVNFNITFNEIEERYIRNINSKWNICRIKDIADVKGGKRLPKGKKLIKENTGYPYLRAGNLKNHSVLEDDIQYLTEEIQKKISNYTISSDDIYITIVGACIGDVGTIPEKLSGANLTENAAKICNINKEYIDKNYLMRWLSSSTGQYFINEKILSATLGKLALNRIKELLVPLPPLEEQKEIVRILDNLLEEESKIDELTQLEEQIELIKKSILAKAFRGQLGTNCPEEESALELLKEILDKE